MKLTITAPYLFVVAVTFAVLSTEATTLRGGQPVAVVDVSQDSLDLARHYAGLNRRVEKDEEQSAEADQEEAEEKSEKQEESDESDETQEDVSEEGEEINEWDKYSEKYKSMSKASQIWIIVLAVWGSILVMTSFYLCCCRKGFKRDKSLMESMKRSLINKPQPVHQI